jgi:anti-sigma B factor antagonist
MDFETSELDGIAVGTPLADHLDASNAKDFKLAASNWLHGKQRAIVNLGNIAFIDSTGLGALLSCFRQVNVDRGEMKLCCMSKPVRTLFELVRMHKVFEIYGSEEEAVRSFPRRAQ